MLLRALAENAGGHGGVLGVFGGFRKDKRGRTDLKGGALFALVSGARVMALAHHVSATATPDRLRLASEQAGAGAADARMLADIHALVLRLILTQQIEDIAAVLGAPSGTATSRLHRAHQRLRTALEADGPKEHRDE